MSTVNKEVRALTIEELDAVSGAAYITDFSIGPAAFSFWDEGWTMWNGRDIVGGEDKDGPF
jgi:hypothetical protein